MKIPSALYSIITWICRIIVGAVFISSGFSKSIDVWGTLYKVNDYLSVLGLQLWPNLILICVFSLCACEFLIGLFILLGCFRRGSIVAATIVMAFMLPLSLWIAIANPVSDCGCFGDAFIISNWTTFEKNIIVVICLCWLLKFNRNTINLISPALQWLCFLASFAFIGFIEVAGYYYQPLIDFRAYPIGSVINDKEDEDSGSTVSFIYKKDNVEQIFNEEDTLPTEDSGWIFVGRIVKDKEDTSNNGHLRIWTIDTDEDVTDEVLNSQDEQILILIPDLKTISLSTSWQLNSLFDWASEKNISVVAIVGSTEDNIESWADTAMPNYPIYKSDNTDIKILARGNPSIVFIQEGIIIWKSTLRALATDDFMQLDSTSTPMLFFHDNIRILINTLTIWGIVILSLMSMTCIARLSKHSKIL